MAFRGTTLFFNERQVLRRNVYVGISPGNELASGNNNQAKLFIHLNDVNETNYNETYGGGSSGAPALSRIVRSNSACSLGVIDTEADVLLPLACAMMIASGKLCKPTGHAP